MRPIFLGRDQDREIRLLKTYYETETEKYLMLIFSTRQDQNETVYFFYVRDRDRDFTWLRISGETEKRPRVLVSFSTRPRREPSYEEND